jgi:hypothetical protein
MGCQFELDKNEMFQPLGPRPRARSAAYHEAGHAVADWVLDQRAPYRIEIRDDGTGYVHVPERVVWIDNEIIRLFAGSRAERRFTPNSRQWRLRLHKREPKDSDRLLITRQLQVLTKSRKKQLALRRKLRKQADDLIDLNLALVEAVAQALLERGTLSGRQFRAIAQAQGGDRARRLPYR